MWVSVCVCYTIEIRFWFIWIMCLTLTISFARALSGVKVDDNHDLIEENQAKQTHKFVMVNAFTVYTHAK